MMKVEDFVKAFVDNGHIHKTPFVRTLLWRRAREKDEKASWMRRLIG